MSTAKGKAQAQAQAQAQGSATTKTAHHHHHQQQILALLLIQDTPQTRASFRHTLQWLIHPVLKNIASSSTLPPNALFTAIVVYSQNHIHTIPFQHALDFLKTCAANARFPFTPHHPLSLQQDHDDDLFTALLAPATPPPSPPPPATATASTINFANILAAVLHIFQQRSPSNTAVDPTNPLPNPYPPTHSRHLIHVASITTHFDFHSTPTTNIASAYDSLHTFALAHEFSKLRALSPTQSIEDPAPSTSTPELAITSIVLRTPHYARPTHTLSTSHKALPPAQPPSAPDPPDSQRLHSLLALSIASHDPLTTMADVDELASSLPDIYDNPRDILTSDEHDSLIAYFQSPPPPPPPSSAAAAAASSASSSSSSSSSTPLILFSNFLTTVRASREAASSRSAESLVRRKRSLTALRASTTSAANAAQSQQQHQQQQQAAESGAPAAKRQKLDKESSNKAKVEPGSKQPTRARAGSITTAAATNSSAPGPNPTTAAAQAQAQQPHNTPTLSNVNFPPNITAGERAKIQFLHQQHALMLKNLATIQQRIQQDQQQQQQQLQQQQQMQNQQNNSQQSVQEEEKRKASVALAQVQVQKVEQVRAK
ncbi:unnamed protein product, partial [Tilletia controversa]